jgi:membrane protease YdiL (CAAX protease family)
MISYAALACLLSWAWWLPMIMLGQTSSVGQGWPTHLPGLLGPAAAAVIVTAAARGRRGLVALGRRCLRWRVGWWPWATVAAVAALSLLPMIMDPTADAGTLLVFSGAPSIGLPVVLYVLVVNGFGEELGWRGLLADEALRRTSRGLTAVIVWAAWALWHLPLFWIVASFRSLGPGGIAGWLVGLLCGSVLLTWLYEGASHSVLVVAAWHTAFNFASATAAAIGLAAAISTTVVMAAAAVLVCLPSTWRTRAGGDAHQVAEAVRSRPRTR